MNRFRCDICGKMVDVEDEDDRLTLIDYRIDDDEIKAKHDITDEDASDATADAMERVAETPKGYDLAETIREKGSIKSHKSCLYETNYGKLETTVRFDN